MKDWLGVPKMHFNANISANEYIGRKNKAKEIKNQMDTLFYLRGSNSSSGFLQNIDILAIILTIYQINFGINNKARVFGNIQNFCLS